MSWREDERREERRDQRRNERKQPRAMKEPKVASGRRNAIDGQRSITARNQQRRLMFAVGLTLVLFASVFGRLCYLHLNPQTEWLEKEASDRTFTEKYRSMRGNILTSDGKVLAMDAACHNIAVDAKYSALKNQTVNEVTSRLAYFLKLDQNDQSKLRVTLSNTNSQYAVVKKRVSFDQGARLKASIEKQKLSGVIIEDAFKREYPKGHTLSHIIGYVNSKGLGYSGIERSMDGSLSGTDGKRVGQLDNRRREIYNRRKLDIAPVPGADIYLTIDLVLQEAMETALQRAMTEFRTLGAWAVLLETKTGAIHAMASKPDFDPNDAAVFSRNGPELMNRVIQQTFEPGSVLKPLSIAAVMNEGLLKRKQGFNCEQGRWFHAGYYLHDAGRHFDWLSLDSILMKSSNIGTAKAVLRLGRMMNGTQNMRLGAQRLYEYYEAFGLTEKSGVSLPGEAIFPLTKPEDWSDVRLSRVAIGQGIAINAIQLAGAINTIANDGLYVRPYLINKIVENNGEKVTRRKAQAKRRVLKASVASNMRDMMRKVVMADPKDCTGSKAKVEGYQTAGKTGTAQKVVNGRYSSTKNISSFVGFVPADEPIFTLVVVLDEPKNPEGGTRQLGGGTSAAHVFRAIAEKTADKLSVPMRDSNTHASLNPGRTGGV